MDRSEKTIIVIIVTIISACICLVLVGAGLVVLVNRSEVTTPLAPTVAVVTATSQPYQSPTPTIPSFNSQTESQDSRDTLSLLESVEIPTADLVLLAERFSGKKDLPRQLANQPQAYNVGDQTSFYTLDNDSNTMNRIPATLQYETEKVYFWIEDDIDFSYSALEALIEDFTETIYPSDREFFGSEWMPGIDNDPHLYILYARDLGSAAGYNSSSDSVLPVVDERSNMHEMFYLSADLVPLDDPYARSVLAHEYQHLIHGYQDPNEEIWLNEGFSELAVFLSGYETGGFDTVFAFNPDVQLNDWSVDGFENSAHYGASFLFTAYLLDRFGEEITRQVVAEPSNGFTSIDKVLRQNGLVDQGNGKQITADDLFADWAIANFLRDPLIGDGRYAYHNYPDAPSFSASESVYSCEDSIVNRDIKQYGIEYIEVDCPGQVVTMEFAGDAEVLVVPAPDTQGKFMWSNRADSSITSISKSFDFTGYAGTLTLEYDTWFDIEPDYDYLYLLAEVGDGEPAEIISTPSCSRLNLIGNNYGCGYNGSSDGWVHEVVDISKFAGKKVTLSFVYITDEAVTGDGVVLDNLDILEVEDFCDFEESNCGWVEQGFARILNIIPQSYLVSVLHGSPVAEVQKFKLDPGEKLDLELVTPSNGNPVIIVVSGAARFTRQESNYQITFKTK